MEAPSTASQISCIWFGEILCLFVHSEKFNFSRPSLTWRAINHEAGGMLLYQGHRVALEWQSTQAR
jgi:hypothetical protein